jgi:hypothetical protein
MKKDILIEDNIAGKILLVRAKRVMLDSELADIYQVETKMLNRAVKRNQKRFPEDFMFQLTNEEWTNLKYQSGTSSWGGRRTLPFVFSEHGAIMLATVLNSQRAIDASIVVVKAFVRLREFVMLSKEIAKKLEEFEQITNKKLTDHDNMFKVVFDILKKVHKQESAPKKPIGFLGE